MNDFYGSRYASCLSHLTKLRPMLELDLHAHVHLNTLYAAVRTPGAQLPPPSPAFVPYFSLILAFSVAVSSLLAQAGSRLPMHLCVREVSVLL